MEGSVISAKPRDLPYVDEDQGYDPATYWAQGPSGHDGTTQSDDERDDWLAIMRDMTGEAERADWRRSLASETDDEPPSLDGMTARGWRIAQNTLAPPRGEDYRGPDHEVQEPEGREEETPTWMGIMTQAPVRPQSMSPWEPRRGFSGTSRVREDSSESEDSFFEVSQR